MRGRVEYCISEICTQRVDITDFYDNWLAIGCSFAYEFKEEGRAYFHNVSQFSTKYTKAATDDQYDQCLKYNYTTSLRPFFSMCKEVDILYNRNLSKVEDDEQENVLSTTRIVINEHGYPAMWDMPFNM